MHIASTLLRIFLATISFLEFLYGILLVLSRCCFHHLVENSILCKKDIQHFYIGTILYSENKIIRSVVGGKVDGQILCGTRSEKPKNLFGTRDEKRKNLFGTKWQSRKILFGSQGVTKIELVRWDLTLLIQTQILSFLPTFPIPAHFSHLKNHLLFLSSLPVLPGSWPFRDAACDMIKYQWIQLLYQFF